MSNIVPLSDEDLNTFRAMLKMEIPDSIDPLFYHLAIRLIAESQLYKSTLQRITVEHIDYDQANGQYGIGVADGHRCCAKLAHAALKGGSKEHND